MYHSYYFTGHMCYLHNGNMIFLLMVIRTTSSHHGLVVNLKQILEMYYNVVMRYLARISDNLFTSMSPIRRAKKIRVNYRGFMADTYVLIGCIYLLKTGAKRAACINKKTIVTFKRICITHFMYNLLC